MFQFIPKVFDGVEVGALCRPVKFFHTDFDRPFLYGPRFVHRGIVVLLHLHCLLFGVLGWVSVQHFEISADVRKDYIHSFDLICHAETGKGLP